MRQIAVFFTIVFLLGLGGVFSSQDTNAYTALTLVRTESSSAVYFIDSNNVRHAFPDAQVYFSWYEDFSTVQFLTDAQMASYPLGSNIVYRPGTNWIKIQSMPNVYAVGQGGEIRWIESEEVAVSLSGTTEWSQRVRDVPDTFFLNYTVGDPITVENVSQGYNGLVYTLSFNPWILWNGQRHGVSDSALFANRLRDEFRVWSSDVHPDISIPLGVPISGGVNDMVDAAQLNAPPVVVTPPVLPDPTDPPTTDPDPDPPVVDPDPVPAPEPDPAPAPEPDPVPEPDPEPDTMLISTLVPEGYSTFTYSDPAVNPALPMTVYTYRPTGLTNDAPVLYVIHGNSRGVESYRSQFVPFADVYGFTVILPHYPVDEYPSRREFPDGNIIASDGSYQPEDVWSATMMDGIFDTFVAGSNTTQVAYDLYGFSAGAQFAHRMAWWKPHAKVGRVMAANAGWYTWSDYSQAYPYGFGNTFVTNERVEASFALPMTVLIGEADNDPNASGLRTTPEAMLQGDNRFDRAVNFYTDAQLFAASNNMTFNWEYVSVPNVGHDNTGMATVAVELLYGN